MNQPSGELLDHLFRQQAGRMVARLTHVLGPSHVTLAEETVQEALLRALQTWPQDGVPHNPAGWLFRVAHNLAIDSVRRTQSFGQKTDAIVAAITQSAQTRETPELDDQIRDDELRMIFMCGHPALSRDGSVALSLKTVGGFSVKEIARAFLADESAIAQRIVRTKKLIRERRLTLDLPSGPGLTERLDAVLDVIYFMFNEGYAAHEGVDLIRQDLCMEALRLGRLVAGARAFDLPRVHALVALMALQAARLPARVDDAGDLILLDDQDRTRWDERLIFLGFQHFDRSMAGAEVTEYHVQAAIAATHGRAADASSVDWRTILELYDQLLEMTASPIVALNRAVAVAKVHGPAAGLDALETISRDPKLQHYHLMLAARGQLLAELGRTDDAAKAFAAALERGCTDPERRFLLRRLAQCRH